MRPRGGGVAHDKMKIAPFRNLLVGQLAGVNVKFFATSIRNVALFVK